MAPFCVFGNDMKHRFNGTLFRFPFRNETTARDSEISNKQYCKKALSELIDNFRAVVSKTLLFLRHVKRIEVYSELDGDILCLKYYAEVTGRQSLSETSSIKQHGRTSLFHLAPKSSLIRTFDESDEIEKFVSGDAHPISKVSHPHGKLWFLHRVLVSLTFRPLC
jgi:hypothetical protein